MRRVLIDASSLGAWLHFAAKSPGAEHNDGIEGVQVWLADFLDRMAKAEQITACFDCTRESNWRKKLYAEYKSGRDSKPKDDDLIALMRDLPSVFKDENIRCLRAEGFEADDLLATLAQQEVWSEEGDDIVIVTRDADLHQLVGGLIQVYDPLDRRLYYVADVMDKHHVMPDRLREFKAINGDSSDSIPGIPGWGKVAAVNAIKQTRSRAELVRKVKAFELRDITKKKQEAFVAHMEDFELFYTIVGLRFDAPIDGAE